MTPPSSVLLDSNALDVLADEPGVFEAVSAAVEGERLRLLWTHVTVDELAAIPDLERRARLLCIGAALARLVPTSAAVVDFSRFDFCTVGAPEDEEALEAYRVGNLRHVRDALIAATAESLRVPVSTRDAGLIARATRRGLVVVDPVDLASWPA